MHGARTFLEWREGELGEVTSLDIDLFLSSWEEAWRGETGRPPRRATVRARIAALRSFFSYLERSGLLRDAAGAATQNPMLAVVAPALEQRANDFLRPIEDQALLDCGSPPAERILVWLLRWTGLRVSEACALKLQDVDLASGREAIVVRKSKTSAGVRTIPLVPPLVPELEAGPALLRARGLGSAQAHVLATASGSAVEPTLDGAS